MTTPPLQTVRDHVRLIVTPIVWDAELAESVQAEVGNWVVANTEAISAAPLAFAADRAVTASLVAVARLMESDPPDTARVALARRMSGASSAGRVAVALHELCGYDIATTAQLSLRSLDDVHRLLNLTPPGVAPPPAPRAALLAGPRTAPPLPGTAPLPAPVPVDAPDAEPSEALLDVPGMVVPPPPPLAPPLAPPPLELPTPGRPHRTVRLSTVLMLSAVFCLVWVITRGGGERPSFAVQTSAPTLGEDNAQVITAGRGCDGPTGLAIGSPTTRSVRLSGAARTYRVFLPTRYQQGQRLPLVVDLGDFGQSADQRATASGWEDLAEEQSFISVTGEPGGPFPQWNVTSALSEMDDVVYINAIISDLFELACVDPARVWVSGHGDGGLMAAAFACTSSGQVAAIASVGGTFVPAGCALGQPVSLLAIHRADDDMFPFDGGIGPAIDAPSQNRASLTAASAVDPESVTQSVATWATLSGCDPGATPEGNDPQRTAYQGCAGGAAVELRSFAGGGHPWTADDLAAVYTFFRDHAKASP